MDLSLQGFESYLGRPLSGIHYTSKNFGLQDFMFLSSNFFSSDYVTKELNNKLFDWSKSSISENENLHSCLPISLKLSEEFPLFTALMRINAFLISIWFASPSDCLLSGSSSVAKTFWLTSREAYSGSTAFKGWSITI